MMCMNNQRIGCPHTTTSSATTAVSVVVAVVGSYSVFMNRSDSNRRTRALSR